MNYEHVFDDGFLEIIKIDNNYEVNGKLVSMKRNVVRRAPGVRAIIVKDNTILLSKEYRYELNKWDYRLPGGKVFDSLNDYKNAIENNTVLENAEKAIIREVKEEVGIDINNYKLIKISNAGSSVIWDLYYYEITDFDIIKNGINLEDNEFVDGFEWKNYDEIIQMCINQEINEDRSIGVLLTYILNKKEK